MAGTIINKGKDTWKIVVSMGAGPDGKRRRHIETVHGKKKIATDRIRELETMKAKGIITPQLRITLEEHINNWLDGYVKNQCSPRTVDSYESIARMHVIPALGHYQLRQLNYLAIEKYYDDKKKDKKKPLTPRTVAKHHRLLSQALKYACKRGYLAINPCDLVDAPKWQPKQMRTLTEREVSVFLRAASSSPYYPVYYTAISTGLRQAELCGLRWEDLILESAPGNSPSLSVNNTLFKRRGVCELHPPKTEYSRRTIKMTDNLVKFLKEYKAERESLYLHLGQLLSRDSYVFGFFGKPCSPSSLSHDFAIIARKVGLKDVCFHTLRHSFATLTLAKHAPAKVISQMLGHASVSFTLQTYVHPEAKEQEEAMSLLNNALPEGILQTGTKMTP